MDTQGRGTQSQEGIAAQVLDGQAFIASFVFDESEGWILEGKRRTSCSRVKLCPEESNS